MDTGELEAHLWTHPLGVLQQAEGGGRGKLECPSVSKDLPGLSWVREPQNERTEEAQT